MLSEFEDRLRDIKRWAVVRTIQTQSVAEHSFNVALIAPRIAKLWYGINGERLLEVVRYALLHDQLEAFSGDVAGMVKDLFDDDALEKRYADCTVIDFPNVHDSTKYVVKAADLYDACHFLAAEISLGNRSVASIYEDNLQALTNHMRATGAGIHVGAALKHLRVREELQVRTMDRRAK